MSPSFRGYKIENLIQKSKQYVLYPLLFQMARVLAEFCAKKRGFVCKKEKRGMENGDAGVEKIRILFRYIDNRMYNGNIVFVLRQGICASQTAETDAGSKGKRENQMKKTIAMLLAAMMCLSLAACGGGSEAGSNAPAVQEPAVSVQPEKAPEAEPAPEAAPAPEVEVEAEPAFDVNWAGTGYAMPIPEPPFAYQIKETSNGVKISSVNGGENGDVTHDKILGYCETLKNIGFDEVVSENVIGERYGRTCYEFSAKSKDGNSLELIDDGGGVVIFAYFEVGASKGETAAGFDTGWASNEFEALIPELPFGGWSTNRESASVYEMELGGLNDQVVTDSNGNTVGYGEDKEAMIAYLESLKDYGFSVEETGGIEGYEYEWLAIDPAGNEIEVTFAEGYCWITITKK